MTTWGPSWFGKLVTGSGSWELVVDDGLTVHQDGTSFRVGLKALKSPLVLPGLLWSSVVVPYEGRRILLRGIPSRSAGELGRAVELMLRVAALQASIDRRVAEVQVWAAGFFDAALPSAVGRRWLSRDFRLRWEEAKPGNGFGELLREPLLADHIAALDLSLIHI